MDLNVFGNSLSMFYEGRVHNMWFHDARRKLVPVLELARPNADG